MAKVADLVSALAACEEEATSNCGEISLVAAEKAVIMWRQAYQQCLSSISGERGKVSLYQWRLITASKRLIRCLSNGIMQPSLILRKEIMLRKTKANVCGNEEAIWRIEASSRK